MPLGIFELKNLNSAEIVPDFTIGFQTNVFCVQVSSWFKKDLIKGERTYYFSVGSKSDVYCWVIYLNFLRMKAIYDNFTIQFGQINLPLSYEILEKQFYLKNKFNKDNIIKDINNFSVTEYLKNAYLRKFIPGMYKPRKDDEDYERDSVEKSMENNETSITNSGTKALKRGSIMNSFSSQLKVRITYNLISPHVF